MSEQTPEKPEGGVPQDVADGLSVLASEVRAAEMRAARGWKIALVFWIILLVVIAGYLYFLVYQRLAEGLQPENVVAMAVTTVEKQVGYELGSTRFNEYLAAQAKNRAPEVMREILKPQVESLIAGLPSRRADAVALVEERVPGLMDHGVDWLENQVMPQANARLLAEIDAGVDSLLDQVDDDLSRIIEEAVQSVGGDVEKLTDKQALRVAMHGAFEDAMGDVLDELLEDIDEKVGSVRKEMASLVEDYKAGDLTHEQRLEIRLVQLVRALFEEGIDEALEDYEGPFAELRGLLEQLDLPEDVSLDVLRQARDPRIGMPDLSRVPEEAREKVEEAIRSIPRRAVPIDVHTPGVEAPAGRRMGPPPDLPTGPPPDLESKVEEGIPEEARRAREQHQQQ